MGPWVVEGIKGVWKGSPHIRAHTKGLGNYPKIVGLRVLKLGLRGLGL